MTSKSESIHIAIVGGGIGGTALGVALSKHPHISFTIYESRSAFGETGAGLYLGANARRALSLISHKISDGYNSRASFNGWTEKQHVWFDYSVGEKGENEGKRIVEVTVDDITLQSTIHRAHFLEELVKLLPDGCAEFNKKLVDIDQAEEKVVLRFADGTESYADAVIGCDGIKSKCRQLVFGRDSKLSIPQFTGKVAYRGLVPIKSAEEAVGVEKANNRQMYLGHGGHVLTFPIANGNLMNVVAFHTSQSTTWEGDWVQPLQNESLQRDFVGWGENVSKIMKLIQGPDVWAIFDLPDVLTFHKDRLCLLGDAAHATSPHFGQGAGMSLEDVYVISNLLGKCASPGDIQIAFRAYDFVRVPRTLKVTALSREQGKLLDMEGDGVGDDLKKLGESIDTTVRWIWNEDLEAHLADALKVFERAKQ